MPNKRSIIFINQSAGYLMTDIINAYEQQYAEITLIAGDLNQRNNKLSGNVKIKRIVEPKRNNAFQRIFTWLFAFVQICWFLLWRSSNAELFIVSNPPLSIFLPLIFKNKFSLLLFDIYPDALYEHQIMKKSSFMYKFWVRANKKVYRRAQNIFSLTEGMKSRAAQYVAEDKIKVVPIWTDNDFFKPILREDNVFVQNNGLEDKFVIMYSGNLGFTHNIEILVDVAKAFTGTNVEVLIIGEGAKKNAIKERIASLRVNNCTLFPWQPMEMLPFSFSSAHIGVVSLGTEASSLSLPSKTFNLMSVGVPILSIAEENSELAKIINQYKVGRSFLTNDLQGMIDFINEMRDDKRKYKELSDYSKAASLHFTPKNAHLFLS